MCTSSSDRNCLDCPESFRRGLLSVAEFCTGVGKGWQGGCFGVFQGK